MTDSMITESKIELGCGLPSLTPALISIGHLYRPALFDKELRVEAWLFEDNHDTQVRTVAKVIAFRTLSGKPSRCRTAELRVFRANGFDSAKNQWGCDGETQHVNKLAGADAEKLLASFTNYISDHLAAFNNGPHFYRQAA